MTEAEAVDALRKQIEDSVFDRLCLGGDKIPYSNSVPDWWAALGQKAFDEVMGKMGICDHHIEHYFITRKSKHDLVLKNHKWCLPNTQPFRSLRTAKTFIKNNVGLMNIEYFMQMPGAIKTVEIKGVFSDE